MHGDVDASTGKRNIVNPKVMAELKLKRYLDDKAQNAIVRILVTIFSHRRDS